MKKKYVLVGASSRVIDMFAKPLIKNFGNTSEIVGIFDTNPLRAEATKKLIGLDNLAAYTNFEKMIQETKPDWGIVTTVDKYHHEYIIKLMEMGVDVITEKPMTMNAENTRAILETRKKTNKKVIVTFNYRFAPYATKIKEIIKSGEIGDILNVDFEYLLDTNHGADYFRRWHAEKENAGGLLVHKATHHFDLVNWWIDDTPEELMAYGSLRFYGHTREERSERCLNCPHKQTCDFYMDIEGNETFKKIYLDCESADGYYRDRCVFADRINIEDTMSVNVKYESGALLSYSLIAHSPYEGYKSSFNGTKGRLEIAEYHSGIKAGEPTYRALLYKRDKTVSEILVPKAAGGHGGGDERLQRMVFAGDLPDPLGYMADATDGAKSIMIGICANMSIKEKRNIVLKEILNWEDYKIKK